MNSDGSREVACGASDGKNATPTGSEVTHQLERDTVAPEVSVTGVVAGGSYPTGTTAAGCNTTDDGSGVATPASIQAPAPDHSTAGPKTATCEGAVDTAGNTAAPVSATYTIVSVTYTALFGQPLDMGGKLNSTKLGRVVPVKVKVLGSDGSYDSNGPVSHQSRKIQCTSGDPVDTIEETLMAGSANAGNAFRWDSTGDQWIFNLDTGKIGARVGDCYQLDVFRGGTVSSTGTVSGGTLIGSVKLTFTK
jgi:hypothetical protein